MAICKECGVEKARMMSDLCGKCISKVPVSISNNEQISDDEQLETHSSRGGSASTCIVLGVLCLAIGLYFLFNPTTDISSVYGAEDLPKVANIHKLTLGQTFSIIGAIFLAAGLRPRG